MKKLFAFLLTTLLLLALIVLPALATDNGEDDRIEAIDAAIANDESPDEEAAVVTTYITDPEPEPSSPYTWEYLATIAGATAFTLLVAQFLKFPLDKVWKIPTRILVYVIALIVMLVATAFTGGLTLSAAGLAVANAFVVAFAAYGAFEVTFARVDR